MLLTADGNSQGINRNSRELSSVNRAQGQQPPLKGNRRCLGYSEQLFGIEGVLPQFPGETVPLVSCTFGPGILFP